MYTTMYKKKTENKHAMIRIFINSAKLYLKLPKCYSYMIWKNFLHCSYGWLLVRVSSKVKGLTIPSQESESKFKVNCDTQDTRQL